MDSHIPELRTNRLLLRGFCGKDFADYQRMTADSEVMAHLGGVLAPPLSWRQMAMHAGHWALRGYGNWAIERLADGVVIGRAGLWNPEGWPGIELGWALRRDAWGHGYATEAAAAALRWGFDDLAIDTILSLIDPSNAASARVAERLDFGFDRRISVGTQEIDVYRRDRQRV